MEARVKPVVEKEPAEAFKIENTRIKIFISDSAYKTDEEVEKALDRISNIWIDAYLGGRYDAEMLEKYGPYEMINIYE